MSVSSMPPPSSCACACVVSPLTSSAIAPIKNKFFTAIPLLLAFKIRVAREKFIHDHSAILVNKINSKERVDYFAPKPCGNRRKRLEKDNTTKAQAVLNRDFS